MGLHIFVLIKQTIHSHHVIQLSKAQATCSQQQIGKGKIEKGISTKILQRLYPVINAETKTSFTLRKPLHCVTERLSSMGRPCVAQVKCVHGLRLQSLAGLALPAQAFPWALPPCWGTACSKAKDSLQCLCCATPPGIVLYCWGREESPVNSNN